MEHIKTNIAAVQEAVFQLSGRAACSQSGETRLHKLPVRPSATTTVPGDGDSTSAATGAH